MKDVIIDLDGTLCDSGHREHLAQAKEWDKFHELLVDDLPNEVVVDFMRSVECERIIFLTGRNEKYRMLTYHWLRKHKIDQFADEVLMRPDNDWRSDHELKPELLFQFYSGHSYALENVSVILEDRDKVVEAWRNHGFTCWQVRPGGY